MIRVALAVVFAAALAGCGSASGSSLDDAADATAAETSRFEMNYEIADPEAKGRKFEFEAEGLFDYPNTRGLITVEGKLPFVGEDGGPTEFRLLGRTSYTRWVIKGKSYWVKEDETGSSGDPIELLIPFPGSPTKPTDALARAVQASDSSEKLGTDVVRGTETTHYRVRVDLKRLVKQLPPSERPEEDVESYWGERFVPVEMWIDDESRLRRITIQQSSKEEEGTAEMTTAVELFDYGVEVDVGPPPAEELISQEELNKLTGESAEVTVGQGEELSLLSPQEVCESARKHLPKKEADRVCLDVKEKQ